MAMMLMMTAMMMMVMTSLAHRLPHSSTRPCSILQIATSTSACIIVIVIASAVVIVIEMYKTWRCALSTATAYS